MTAPIQFLPRLLLIKSQFDKDPDTGDTYENVMWWISGLTTAPTLANLVAIQAIFDPNFANLWKQVGATAKHYNGSIIQDYSSNTGLVNDTVGTFTPVAGNASGLLPPNTNVLLSLKTLEHYRGGHGRIYLPWIGSAVVDSADPSHVGSGYYPFLSTWWNTLVTDMGGSGVLGGQGPVVYRHRRIAGSAQVFDVTSAVGQQTFATQRRRLRKAPHH